MGFVALVVIQLLVLAEAVNLTDVYPTYRSEACSFFTNLDTSAVDTLDSAFENSRLVCDGEPWRWDVTRVTSMENAFRNASTFNSEIGSWDVTRVTNMNYTFNAAAFNSDIGNWDVSKVIAMFATFYSAAAFNSDIGSWDVTQVTTMYATFNSAAAFNSDIGSWDVTQVTALDGTFYFAAAFNSDIGSWDVTQVTALGSTFSGTAFNSDIGNWDVTRVTTLSGTFWSAAAFNSDIGNWDVTRVTNMFWTFNRALAFNGDIASWDVTQVTRMYGTFNSAEAFNGDLSSWDVTQVNTMAVTFNAAEAFNGDLRSWCVTAVTSHSRFCTDSAGCTEPIWGTCPTGAPTAAPTFSPTGTPTPAPTGAPTDPTASPTSSPTGPASARTARAASWVQANPLYLVMVVLVPLLIGFQFLTRRYSAIDEGSVNHFLPLALVLRLFDTATDIAAATERVGGILGATVMFIVLPIIVEFGLGLWLHAQMLATSTDLSRWRRQVPFADSMTHMALVLCAFCGPQALKLLTCNLFNHPLVRAPLTKFDDTAMIISLASLLEDIPQVIISVVFLSTGNQNKPSAATWLSLGVCVVSILWAIASKFSLLLVTRSNKAVTGLRTRVSLSVQPQQIAKVGSDGQLHCQERQDDAPMPDLSELVHHAV